MRSWAVAALIVVAMAGVACHETQSLVYENATTMTLTIIIDYYDEFTLEPGQIEKLRVRENGTPARVMAYDEDGVLRFVHDYAWEELKQAGWLVTIIP